jgi:hypothetical protein
MRVYKGKTGNLLQFSGMFNPLTPKDLQKRRAIKICVKNQQMQQLFIQFINYVWCLMAWCVHHATKHNTPIHNILSTAPQLSISKKALGTLPEDGNVMPKHVGTTIHN